MRYVEMCLLAFSMGMLVHLTYESRHVRRGYMLAKRVNEILKERGKNYRVIFNARTGRIEEFEL